VSAQAEQLPPEPLRGRPSGFSVELGDRICEALADGLSVRRIMRTESFSMSMLFRWLRQFPDFREQYARARSDQAHALVMDALDIADDGGQDYVTEDGEVRFNSEHVQRSRLRVDTRKWYASKVLPKIYGERILHEDATGGGALNNLTPAQVVDRLVSMANAHPIMAEPLRELLQSALDRLPRLLESVDSAPVQKKARR
jgi:hypothetical protein